MSWLVDSGTTFPVKLGNGVSFRFIRNEWQWFYSNEYSRAYDDENEREVLLTKQVVFFKSPLEILKIIGQHSVEDEDMWDSVYRHRGIYLTLSEAIREVQELKLQFDAQLNWLFSSPFEKVDKIAYLSYLLRVAIGRIGHLRANSTAGSSLSAPPWILPPKEAVDGDVDNAAPIQSALPSPLPEADIPKGGEVSDLGQPHGLPDYEVFQPVEVVFKQESVTSVIREIAALCKFYADAVPPKFLDTLMPHAGFLYCRHQPFADTDVDVLLDWLENWSKELLSQYNRPLAQNPPSVVAPPKGKAPLERGRRGRLPTDEKKALEARVLAQLREHPTMMDDPALLAVTVGVSVSSIRRWIKDLRRKNRESRRQQDDESE